MFFINQFYVRVFFLEPNLEDFFTYLNDMLIFNTFFKAKNMSKKLSIFFYFV